MIKISCPLCENNDLSEYLRGIFDSSQTRVFECKVCGMQFLYPMMSDREEKSYYENYYKKQEIRQYKKLSFKEIQENSFKHYCQYRSKYRNIIKDKKKVLEIGSGCGGFIKFLRLNRPDAKITAIERSKPNKEFLKKNFKDLSCFDDIMNIKDGEKFDLIAGFGILDHIKDGISFLTRLKKFLGEKGSVVFNVCNPRNPLISIYGLEEFKRFSYMKQHPCIYSEKALKILAEKSKFKIKKMDYLQVWSLDNHLSWLRNRRPHDFSAYSRILPKSMLNFYNNMLIKMKTTDLIMVTMESCN